jgi:hypothetical protein
MKTVIFAAALFIAAAISVNKAEVQVRVNLNGKYWLAAFMGAERI